MFHVKHQAGSESPLTPEGIVEAINAMAHELGVPGLGIAINSPTGNVLIELSMGLWASERVGLTSYHSLQEVVGGLVLPSVAAFRWLEPDKPLDIVEIGAGAGALGLTLALVAPSWRVTLVDRREKAVAFMEIIATRLKLANAYPVAGDMRKRGPDAELYDAALFRAVGSPEEDLEIALGWVKPGGLCLIWTSARAEIPPDTALWSQVGAVAARDDRMSVLAFRKA
jgi:16S rRNA G527 N7-methylase RsmG